MFDDKLCANGSCYSGINGSCYSGILRVVTLLQASEILYNKDF